MDIIHPIHDNSFGINDPEALKAKLVEHYTYNGVAPQVEIRDGFVFIHIDESLLSSIDNHLEKALDMVKRGDYRKAMKEYESIISKYPMHSEAYRMLAQVKMTLKDIDGATNDLILALKNDPRNYWALILMGNILAKYQNNLAAGEKYYRTAYEYYPKNVIVLNNLAAVLVEKKQYNEAYSLFDQALAIDDTYANTYFGLAMVQTMLGDATGSFTTLLNGALKSEERLENQGARKHLLEQMVYTAQVLKKVTNIFPLVEKIKKQLEDFDGIPIDMLVDKNPSYLAAHMEYAPYHHAASHKVVYDSNKPHYEHALVHELMHLEMMQKATKAGTGKCITEADSAQSWFNGQFGASFNRLGLVIGRSKASNMAREFLKGISLQIMNCPLDLYVERLMYDNYPQFRHIQLLGLLDNDSMALKGLQMSAKNRVYPDKLISAIRIMNVISSLQLKELFGIDHIADFKPSRDEMKISADFFERYKRCSQNHKPGDEYQLVEYLAQAVGCSPLLSIVDEEQANGAASPGVPSSYTDPNKAHERFLKEREFQENHTDEQGTPVTMMMTMYMLGALKYFKDKPMEFVKKCAFEIATLGMGGISPDKKEGYKIPSIDRDFGGYEMLAYYYVSWAIAIPDKLKLLELPFDTAYQNALQMFKMMK